MVTTMPWHTVYAPAKLNRFLHITGRREDGYHTLQSLIVKIGLFDILQFRLRHDGVIRLLNPHENIPTDQDLVVKAAKALQQHTHTSYGVDILIDKHIPMGAGLGGGSSDAASTLMALNHLWETELSNTDLARIGLSLGADIPFFIEGGRSAWVSGIGNIVIPIVTRLPIAYCLMQPPLHLSTAEIFNAEELRRSDTPLTIDALEESHSSVKWDNAMEETARKIFPELNDYAATFAQWAKEMHWPEPQMTGSGSCFFIPLSTEQWSDQAEIATALYRAKDFFKWRSALEIPKFWLVPQL